MPNYLVTGKDSQGKPASQLVSALNPDVAKALVDFDAETVTERQDKKRPAKSKAKEWVPTYWAIQIVAALMMLVGILLLLAGCLPITDDTVSRVGTTIIAILLIGFGCVLEMLRDIAINSYRK